MSYDDYDDQSTGWDDEDYDDESDPSILSDSDNSLRTFLDEFHARSAA